MGTSSVNPHEVFRSGLPAGTSLIVVFVPSKDRAGEPIDQDYWVDEVLSTRQGEIGVVIDGKYYGITDYIPE